MQTLALIVRLPSQRTPMLQEDKAYERFYTLDRFATSGDREQSAKGTHR